MSFAILRTQKLTAAKIGNANAHNTREMNVPNADPELRGYNTQLAGTKNLKDDINNRLQAVGIKKTREDAVLGIEHVMTASPEFFNYKKSEEGKLQGNVPQWQKFEEECMNWLNDRYGKENVVNVHIHKDEKTPHIHAIVTPIVQKEVKWKNKQGEGSKMQNRLCAKDFLNGKEKMTEMQDSFANHLQKSSLKLQRGEKGSKATHQEVQKFYENIKEGEKSSQIPIYQVQEIEVKKSPLTGKEEFAKQESLRINKEITQMVSKFSLDKFNLVKSHNSLKDENNKLKSEKTKYLKQIDSLKFEVKQEKENTKKWINKANTILEKGSTKEIQQEVKQAKNEIEQKNTTGKSRGNQMSK